MGRFKCPFFEARGVDPTRVRGQTKGGRELTTYYPERHGAESTTSYSTTLEREQVPLLACVDKRRGELTTYSAEQCSRKQHKLVESSSSRYYGCS